jgi:ribose 5-phosphate isomerase RpiB
MSGENGQVLCWPKRVLSADDLRRHLTGQRELQLLPRAIITPLAADELKARGVRVSWQDAPANGTKAAMGTWGYAQERPDALVDSVVRALERDGIALAALRLRVHSPCDWSKAVATTIAQSAHPGVVAFCTDAGLVCCVANKLSGVRAVPIATVAQANKARASLGANLLAIELPGPTFFELRQIVRAVCNTGTCPENIAAALKELDGHAHR